MAWGLLQKWRGRRDRKNEVPIGIAGKVDLPDKGEMQALVLDPWEMNQAQEWVDRLSTKSVYTAPVYRSMAELPWVAMIHAPFINRMARFSRPQETPYSLGFRIMLRDKRKPPSAAERKRIEEVTRMVQTCGNFRNDAERYTRDDFETFVRKVEQDSLTYATMTWEISRDRRGKPAAWEARDASTIYRVRPASPYGLYTPGDAAYCQVVDGKATVWFGPEELCFAIRRPSSDIKSAGYGRPELMEALSLVNNILMAYVFNANFFKQGGPPGVLNMIGDVPKEKFEGFARAVRFMLSGVRNAFRTPIVQTPQGSDMKWVPFTNLSQKEMQFAEWVRNNYQDLCSLYGISPEDTGHYFGNSGQRSTLSEGGVADKIQAGSERGYIPHVYAFENAFNRSVIHPLTDDEMEFRCCGLDALSPKDKAELDKLRCECSTTPNEVRAEDDREPLPGGDRILSPYYQDPTAAPGAGQPGVPGQGPEAGPGEAGEGPEGQPARDPVDDWGDEATKSLARRGPRRFTIEV